MNTFRMFLLGLFCIAQSAMAQDGLRYSCVPTTADGSIEKVTVSYQAQMGDILTIFSRDTEGRVDERRSKAEYYDDMTYFGYFSDALKANLTFDYPFTPDALFEFKNQRIDVRCTQF